MLAKKNEDIGKAYDILMVMSKNEKARLAYEAREAEIHDQATREKTAKEDGIKEKAIEDAINFLKLGVNEETVSKGTGLSLEKVLELKYKANSK